MLKVLRQETSFLHSYIETKQPFSSLLKSSLTVEQYMAALIVLERLNISILDYISKNSPSVSKSIESGLEDNCRNLNDDLTALQDSAEEWVKPVLHKKFHILDDAYLMGALYVLTGSSNGAKVLLPAIKRSDIGDACAHLYYLNLLQRNDWSIYKEALSGFDTSKPAIASNVIAGARGAFSFLISLCDEVNSKCSENLNKACVSSLS